MTTKTYDILARISAKGYENESGMFVSRESADKAWHFVMGKIDGLQNKAKGLHYGKPRRNAINAEIERWFEIEDELSASLLGIGEADSWTPVA